MLKTLQDIIKENSSRTARLASGTLLFLTLSNLYTFLRAHFFTGVQSVSMAIFLLRIYFIYRVSDRIIYAWQFEGVSLALLVEIEKKMRLVYEHKLASVRPAAIEKKKVRRIKLSQLTADDRSQSAAVAQVIDAAELARFSYFLCEHGGRDWFCVHELSRKRQLFVDKFIELIRQLLQQRRGTLQEILALCSNTKDGFIRNKRVDALSEYIARYEDCQRSDQQEELGSQKELNSFAKQFGIDSASLIADILQVQSQWYSERKHWVRLRKGKRKESYYTLPRIIYPLEVDEFSASITTKVVKLTSYQQLVVSEKEIKQWVEANYSIARQQTVDSDCEVVFGQSCFLLKASAHKIGDDDEAKPLESVIKVGKSRVLFRPLDTDGGELLVERPSCCCYNVNTMLLMQVFFLVTKFHWAFMQNRPVEEDVTSIWFFTELVIYLGSLAETILVDEQSEKCHRSLGVLAEYVKQDVNVLASAMTLRSVR